MVPSPRGKDKSENRRGSWDFWIIKTDADHNKQWDKTFGGTSPDYLYVIKQTSDGGYIMGGYSYSDSGADKSENGRGSRDYWIIKADAKGNKQWDKTLGGSGEDELYSIDQTNDGGYILGGESLSPISGDKTEDGHGLRDFWIVKIDGNGNKQWDKCYGGSKNEYLNSVIKTNDDGYMLAGSSFSDNDGDKTQVSRGFDDFWIVKTDVNGNKQWDKTFGGSKNDAAIMIQQTSDRNYIIGGYSSSDVSGDKTSKSRGGGDYWLVRIDATGTKMWDATFGGDKDENNGKVQQCPDGGFIVSGISASGINGDKTEGNWGVVDYWIVKTGAEILPLNFVSFSAVVKREVVALIWATVNEINNDYFIIQRSNNNKDFISIGTIYSKGDGAFQYSFEDNTPLMGSSYYRLKQIDRDGKFSYSKILSVSDYTQQSLLQITPNPTTGNTTLILSNKNEKVKIKVIGSDGKVVWQVVTSESNIVIPSQQFGSGVYDVQVIGNDKISNVKFVKQ